MKSTAANRLENQIHYPTNDEASPGAQLARDLGPSGSTTSMAQRRGRVKMILLFLFCMTPVLASYFAYYFFRPAGSTTNYGELIEPQRPLPSTLVVRDENGQVARLDTMLAGPFAKKWLLVSVDAAANCADACAKKLFFMRQLRIAQGAQRTRIVPLWLISDNAAVAPVLQQAYGDTYAAVRFLHTDIKQLQAWLPSAANHTPNDYLYLIDPLGNLMMRFPANPDANKMRADLAKLLKWNVIGQGESQAWK